ncbi:MAG: NADH-quinone oxidoreductase subunit J [Bacillota bacterium]|nr:NADH-quinone oxidoreductase subunit J [Bacillota bacterium]
MGSFFIIVILLLALIVSAVVCVQISVLVKAGIALAVTSAILSVIMFRLGAALAAAFELSVCAGLITVIFISAVSMTKIMSKEELAEKRRERNKRFASLPAILIVVFAAALFFFWPHIDATLPFAASAQGDTVQNILWNKRQVDLIGQAVIMLIGVYGVMVFFRESDKE